MYVNMVTDDTLHPLFSVVYSKWGYLMVRAAKNMLMLIKSVEKS